MTRISLDISYSCRW